MEMLAVLAIIGIVAAIAVPGLFRQPAGVARGHAIIELERHIAAAAYQARSSGKAVRFDLVGKIPGSSWKPVIGSDTGLIFYPDGSSNGGILSTKERQILAVRWLDGHIKLTHD